MNKEQIIQKLTSRKFWISVAAFLGSIATSIAGFAANDSIIIAIGLVCSTLSAAIYAAAESYTDGARAKSDSKTVTIAATSNSKETVEQALAPVTPTTEKSV